MTFHSATPVASGRPYHVKACKGRVPTALADFEGETDFTLSTGTLSTGTLSTGTLTTVIRGIGAAQGDWVRFHEKDVAHDGKDVRVWHIIMEADGGFTATTGPSVLFAVGWPLDPSSVPPA
jgi:hypothetical protein